jgi:hypothetical protein
MTHIAEATAVKLAPERAREKFLKYFCGLAHSSDGYATLRLRAGPMNGGLQLEHDVDVEVKPALDQQGLEYPVDIAWKPKGTDLLPSFNGLLRFQYDENYGNTWLVIEGDYEPPLGLAGKVFDEVAGQRIARTTLRALLDEFRSTLE